MGAAWIHLSFPPLTLEAGLTVHAQSPEEKQQTLKAAALDKCLRHSLLVPSQASVLPKLCCPYLS